jgi:hypothetical protein
MKEDEFIRSLEALLQRCPDFMLERSTPDGDIVLRRMKKTVTSERSRALAAAFKGIMRSDSKTPRGGGWI